MNNVLLFNKLATLPEGLKQEVAEFIERLMLQSKNKNTPKNKAKFGSGKGMITILPGFDEPLTDFSEYTH